MEGIPLERISQVRTTANSIGYIWAACSSPWPRSGASTRTRFGMFIQNDVLKEYIARGTQIFPPAAVAPRCRVDVLEYASRTMPALGAARRSPATTSASPAPTRRRRSRSRSPTRSPTSTPPSSAGVSIDAVAPSAVHVPLGRDRAPARRSRSSGPRGACGPRLHPRAVRRAGPADASSCASSSFTAGSSLTAQQPLNNVVRATARGAGGRARRACRRCTSAPTTRRSASRPRPAATLALRTQQIVAYETGLDRDGRPARRLATRSRR